MKSKSIAVKNSNQQKTETSRLLSRREVADLLNVCPHTIQRMERAGRLTSIKFNRRLLRYREHDVQQLIEEGEGQLNFVRAKMEAK